MAFSRSGASVALGRMSNPLFPGSGSGTGQQSSELRDIFGPYADNVVKCTALGMAYADALETQATHVGYMYNALSACWTEPDCFERVWKLYGAAYEQNEEAVANAKEALREAGCIFW